MQEVRFPAQETLTGDEFCDRLITKMNVQHNDELDKGVKEFYVISDKLGEGAFATVYRGVDRSNGHEVALKVVSLKDKEEGKKVIGSAEALKKREEKRKRKLRRKVRILDNEIAVLRKIAGLTKKRQKSLVVLHDVIAKPHEITVVMELLTGGELFDRVLELGSYTEADAALIMKRVMRGVRSLHMADIIHRDLKPENLVFKTKAPDSQIKITDFGLALIEGRKDIFENIVIGSPGYIAPEVITDRSYTKACDIWSMGCILYILLVGGPPFGANSNQELFEMIKAGKYGYPTDSVISDSGKDLIDRMLTLDPKYRIDANGVMKHPWLLKRAAGADLKNTVIKLRNFNARRKIKAVALSMVYGNNQSPVASNLRKALRGSSREEGFTGEEIEGIRDLLFQYSPDGRSINRSEFQKLFLEKEYTDIDADKVFDVFANGREYADVPEICIGLSTTSKTWTGSEALRFCFETYDRDKTGEIPKEDVQKILRAIMGDGPFKNISAGLVTFFNKFRNKSNNNVSFQDFRQQFMRYGDSALKKTVQPVNKLLKRITQIPQIQLAKNKLSMSFTLASVKSSASGFTDTGETAEVPKKSFAEDVTDEDDDEDDKRTLGTTPPAVTQTVTPPPPTLPKEKLSNRTGEKPKSRFSWSIKDLDNEL